MSNGTRTLLVGLTSFVARFVVAMAFLLVGVYKVERLPSSTMAPAKRSSRFALMGTSVSVGSAASVYAAITLRAALAAGLFAALSGLVLAVVGRRRLRASVPA